MTSPKPPPPPEEHVWPYLHFRGATAFVRTDWAKVPKHPSVDISIKPRYLTCRQTIQFPVPQDLNINMMPFIIGDRDSIPIELLPWWPIITSSRLDICHSGEIGYITIREGFIEAGQTQSRPGLHTDLHPNVEFDLPNSLLRGGSGKICKNPPAAWHWYELCSSFSCISFIDSHF